MACNITSLTMSAMAMFGAGAGVPISLTTHFAGLVRLRDPRFRAPCMGIAVFTTPAARIA